jgi:hypothetical protein
LENKFTQGFPHGKQVYAVGLAAVCLPMWKIRNTVWKIRNILCFEGKRVKSPTEIICIILFPILLGIGQEFIPQLEQSVGVPCFMSFDLIESSGIQVSA